MGPPLVAAGAAVWTTAVIARMRREYAETDTFRASTTVLLYSGYGAAAWAAYRRAWPLRLPRRGAAAAALDVWVGAEEEHLRRVFGPDYDAYARDVPRWWGR